MNKETRALKVLGLSWKERLMYRLLRALGKTKLEALRRIS